MESAQGLYVTGFDPSDIQKEDLEKMFARFGEIERIDYKNTFAFVFMRDGSKEALKELNMMTLDNRGQRLRVSFVNSKSSTRRRELERQEKAENEPNETIFVANYDLRNTREGDIANLFRKFGDIDNVDMRSKYCFVTFRNQDSAVRAKNEMDGHKVGNLSLKIQYRTGSVRRGRSPSRSPPPHLSHPRRYSRSPPPRRFSRSPPPHPRRYSRSPPPPHPPHARRLSRSPPPRRFSRSPPPRYQPPPRNSPPPRRSPPPYHRGQSPPRQDRRYPDDRAPPRGYDRPRDVSPRSRVQRSPPRGRQGPPSPPRGRDYSPPRYEPVRRSPPRSSFNRDGRRQSPPPYRTAIRR